jgi:hypothetical protein
MRRREFLTLVGGSAAAWPLAVRAQQTKEMRRIGVFVPGSARTHGQYVKAFQTALSDLGYEEGSNYALNVRWGEGGFERRPDLRHFADNRLHIGC